MKNTSLASTLMLDGESADVHLGRFTEVAHGRSYSDMITLGFSLDKTRYNKIDDAGKMVSAVGRARMKWTFRCIKRTQETCLSGGEFLIDSHRYKLSKKGKNLFLTNMQTNNSVVCKRPRSFLVDPFLAVRAAKSKTAFDVFREFVPVWSLNQTIQEELLNTRYLGPFRQQPLRRYPMHGANRTEVGALGEGTVPMLANETIQSRSRQHLARVAKWLNEMGLAQRIDLTRVGSSDLFDVSLGLPDGVKLPLADLGYGCSQVLPVIAQCSYCDSSATLLFEQPELHLHSVSARALAGVFIDTAKRTDAKILIETHSPDMLKEFFSRMRKGQFRLDDFVAYKVTRLDKETQLREIAIDPDDIDVLDNWEKGISIN